MAIPKTTPIPMPAFAAVLRPEDCVSADGLELLLFAPVVAEIVGLMVELPVFEMS
jgi:hypothetical protein